MGKKDVDVNRNAETMKKRARKKERKRGTEFQTVWVRQGGPVVLFTVLIPCIVLFEWLTPEQHMEANAGHQSF